jgi:hypothetical protein
VTVETSGEFVFKPPNHPLSGVLGPDPEFLGDLIELFTPIGKRKNRVGVVRQFLLFGVDEFVLDSLTRDRRRFRKVAFDLRMRFE